MTTNKLSNQGTNNGYMIGKQINNYSEYVRVPTFLTALIKKLCKVLDSEVNEAKLELLPFTPEEKISYNNVIQYEEIITEYAKFYMICDQILNTLDDYEMGCKDKILKSIKLQYSIIVGELKKENPSIPKLQLIRDNADNIITKVRDFLRERLEHGTEEVTQEDIDYGLIIVICYAFLNCKILENPRGEL
jgi:hypothetical protein